MKTLFSRRSVAHYSTTTTPNAIVTERLTKRYGNVTALEDLSLTVPTGMIYGFLGPNGAGKTTTIRILLGFIRATEGRATVGAHDVWRHGVKARQNLGYLVPPEALYPDMTGTAQLKYAARLSGRPAVLRAPFLEALGLGGAALDQRLGTYSKGMRQKLALTAAFQTDPELVILDEPTDGLDPLVQRNFEALLRERRDAGRTIFMSSHDLAEVERVCERVAIVRGGRLIAEETVEGLTRRRLRTVEVVFARDIPAHLDQIPNTMLQHRNHRRVRLTVEGDMSPLLRVLARSEVEDVTITPPKLEDIFMSFYNGQADGAAPRNGVEKNLVGVGRDWNGQDCPP